LAWPNWLWCKQDETGDDGQVPGFVPVEELFKDRHFDREIVVLCVPWYLSFKLSYRDLVARIGERGIHLAHTTTLRWFSTMLWSSRNDGSGRFGR